MGRSDYIEFNRSRKMSAFGRSMKSCFIFSSSFSFHQMLHEMFWSQLIVKGFFSSSRFKNREVMLLRGDIFSFCYLREFKESCSQFSIFGLTIGIPNCFNEAKILIQFIFECTCCDFKFDF